MRASDTFAGRLQILIDADLLRPEAPLFFTAPAGDMTVLHLHGNGCYMESDCTDVTVADFIAQAGPNASACGCIMQWHDFDEYANVIWRAEADLATHTGDTSSTAMWRRKSLTSQAAILRSRAVFTATYPELPYNAYLQARLAAVNDALHSEADKIASGQLIHDELARSVRNVASGWQACPKDRKSSYAEHVTDLHDTDADTALHGWRIETLNTVHGFDTLNGYADLEKWLTPRSWFRVTTGQNVPKRAVGSSLTWLPCSTPGTFLVSVPVIIALHGPLQATDCVVADVGQSAEDVISAYELVGVGNATRAAQITAGLAAAAAS